MSSKSSGGSDIGALPGPRTSWRTPPRCVLEDFATSAVKVIHVEYTPGCCFARHSESLPFLACTVRGVHWSSNSQGGYTCLPGTVRFLPAGEPHENYFPAHSRCVLIKLLPPMLARVVDEASLPDGPVQIAHPAAALAARLLRKELHRQDNLSPLTVEELSLELLLAGNRLPVRSCRSVPAWLRRVHEMLREESGRRFTLHELGRSVGRHPVQVCRQFHRTFSCTIGEYVRRFRVARAQALLAASELSIVEIALTCGFADQSQLTTTFRRLTGIAPGRYRKQFAPSAPVARPERPARHAATCRA